MRNHDILRPSVLIRTIPSDLVAVDDVCRKARCLMECQGQAEHTFAVELLLREFLNNAVLHGNVSVREKKVRVKIMLGRKWIVLWIGDEGPGFDWRTVQRRIPDDVAVSGRGIAIGMHYADVMRFNRAGNQVTLWIRKTLRKETAL